MKAVKLGRRISIRKVRGNWTQTCTHCGGKLPGGLVAVSISKPISSGQAPMNIWFHVNCLEPCMKGIMKNIKTHKNHILSEIV